MHAFMLLCLVAVAAAQYQYASQDQSQVNNGEDGTGVNDGNSEDILAPVQSVVEEYNKSFYSYSAPEQEFDDLNVSEKIANSMKKNIRVIFIKGPENSGFENAALQLAQSASDDRTAIYVLSKQSDIGDLANQLQQLKSNNAVKPDVHFVKYRTQADAENAQRTIQAQYDTLPGATSNNAPVSASVLDFASKLSSSPATINAAARAPVATPTVARTRGYIPPRSSYIPPSKRFSV